MFLECYVVTHCKNMKKFTFGSLQAGLSIDNGYITKFKNPKYSVLKELYSKNEIIKYIHTPETFLPFSEATPTFSSGIQIKPRAIKRLKRFLRVSDVWVDISTSYID